MQTSQDELHVLCEENDIVCLQETWLAKEQLPLLSNVHPQCMGSGVSSIEDETRINSGRPHGGIGIIWKKTLNQYCKIRTYDCDRILGIELNFNSFSVLILCVYLPFDSSDHYDDFMFLLNKIVDIIDSHSSPYVYVNGDFNANMRTPSRFGKELSLTCKDNSLCLSDYLLLPADTFTYISASHGTVSWLDHILTTTSGHTLIQRICTMNEYVSSDHLPVLYDILIDNFQICVPVLRSNSNKISSQNWYNATEDNLLQYRSATKTELQKIKLPLDAVQCQNPACTEHNRDIDHLYYAITNTLDRCTKTCIPAHRGQHDHAIRGWNDQVKHHHQDARREFRWWQINGKPRNGPIFRSMSKARARFKYALRQCRLDELSISNTKLAYYMQSHDVNNFWKEVSKHGKSTSALSNCIEGTTGEDNIAQLWGTHYRDLLNSGSNNSQQDDVRHSMNNVVFDDTMHVSVNECIDIIKDLPFGKAAGPDGLTAESLKHADVILPVLMSICFTCMFKHSYMPQLMLDSVIIPLVKNRCGDLSDKNNYRPIALSSVLSKVFETVILQRLETYIWTSDNQFGFKPAHSTDLCVYAVSDFISYLKSRSTSVYVAFLDASKAFDKINHWTLFKRLINRHVPIFLVRILCFWYQRQQMSVRWGSKLSPPFSVSNGVRQGGILSPCLFNVYLDTLSTLLNDSGIGGSIGGKMINHLIYADDICIISQSSAGLQQLLNICTEFGNQHDLSFNITKSVCMSFHCAVNKKCANPDIRLNKQPLAFVDETKYLGVVMSSTSKTTLDVSRQTRKFYMQANILLRNFGHCSEQVKCSLFQTYCSSMYCSSLWYNSTKTSINKLRVSYNQCLRRLLRLPYRYSASEMFVSRHIPSFNEVLRKSVHSMINRIDSSQNSILIACKSHLVHMSSPIRQWWGFLLYM